MMMTIITVSLSSQLLVYVSPRRKKKRNEIEKNEIERDKDREREKKNGITGVVRRILLSQNVPWSRNWS